jgi:hypothetical protein
MADNIPEYEKQIESMRAVMQALKPLDKEAQLAVLAWVSGQLGVSNPAPAQAVARERAPAHSTGRREGTVSMVAQKLSAKSSRDLFLAASAHLTFFQGNESFTKDELVACAKEARAWKTDYSNQIASNLKRMMDAGTLFEKSKNVVSLSDSARADLESKIAR